VHGQRIEIYYDTHRSCITLYYTYFDDFCVYCSVACRSAAVYITRRRRADNNNIDFARNMCTSAETWYTCRPKIPAYFSFPQKSKTFSLHRHCCIIIVNPGIIQVPSCIYWKNAEKLNVNNLTIIYLRYSLMHVHVIFCLCFHRHYYN